jgi:aminoglycoside phosphotransferase (APT) family kinase protein
MHENEVRVSTAMAKRLVDAQMPALAGLSLRPLGAGTDNSLFRLGPDLVLRFPRRPSAAALLARECAWLPHMNGLPLAVPELIAQGQAEMDYPWDWAVFRWLPGSEARLTPIADPRQAASDLARFVVTLRDLPGAGGPVAGSANHHRGVPLAERDADLAAALAAIGDLYDTTRLFALWEAALQAQPWDGPPRWLHGDLHGSNLLVAAGRLSGVIDFGLMARGDPATDLMPAWTLFDGTARTRFLDRAAPDDAAVARGRGWTLHGGAIALARYRDRDQVIARRSTAMLDAVLAEV